MAGNLQRGLTYLVVSLSGLLGLNLAADHRPQADAAVGAAYSVLHTQEPAPAIDPTPPAPVPDTPPDGSETPTEPAAGSTTEGAQHCAAPPAAGDAASGGSRSTATTTRPRRRWLFRGRR